MSLAELIELIGVAIFVGSLVATLVFLFLAWRNVRPGYRWIDATRMWHGERKPKWLYDFYQRIVWYRIYTPEEVLTERGLAYYRRIRLLQIVAIVGFAVGIWGGMLGP